METKLSTELLQQLVQKAYSTAKSKGFLKADTNINQELMLIITEMAEVVQANRHDKRANIKRYEELLAASDELAYEHSLEGTVESEFSDICIRILSFLGWLQDKKPYMYYDDKHIAEEIKFHQLEHQRCCFSIPTAMYNIITHMTYIPIGISPIWVSAVHMQDILLQVIALANALRIDIFKHIRLKMKYNESRPYLHGCLF